MSLVDESHKENLQKNAKNVLFDLKSHHHTLQCIDFLATVLRLLSEITIDETFMYPINRDIYVTLE